MKASPCSAMLDARLGRLVIVNSDQVQREK